MTNKLKICLLLLLNFTIAASYAYERRDLLQSKSSVNNLKFCLLPKEKWISYPDYTDRTQWKKIVGNNADMFIEKGVQALTYEWEVIKVTDYLAYERNGSRTIMEEPYNKNITTIAALLMAELSEGKGRFIDQLANGAFALCEMTSWSIAAHLPLQTTKSVIPNHNEQIIELVSGDVGSLLSWTYYFFHKEFDKLNPIISERLKNEIQKKILDPYMNIHHLWWMGFEYEPGKTINNWNPWCNSNVLQCFVLMEEDPERLTMAVHKTMVSIDQFINYLNEDGACEEGPSYWGHAAGKLYDYLQILYDITGGKISIFNEPIVKNMGEYISRSYVGNGWVVNFADASAKLKPEADLIYRYGHAVKSNEMMQFAAYLKSTGHDTVSSSNTRDIFRLLQTIYYSNTMKDVESLYNTPSYSWYPQTQFCYIKNDEMFFAVKGGFNSESHNHNDIGTFNLYFNNEPIFIDVGVGIYTKKTFSADRYTIWTMQSAYHNLPEINGYQQSFGERYKAKDAIFNNVANTFSLDISGAYPQEANINSWKRIYKIQNKNTLVITDQYDLKNVTSFNKINFLTRGNIEITTPGIISIRINNENIRLYYEKHKLDGKIETIQIDDEKLANVWGKELFRISLTAKDKKQKDIYKYSIVKI